MQKVNRRQILKGSGVALAVGLAGCSGALESESESSRIIRQRLEEDGPDYYIEDYSVEKLDAAIRMELTADVVTDDELFSAIGFAIGAYSVAIERTGVRVDAEATMFDMSGDFICDWICRSEWAAQYNDGALTARQLSAKVIRTIGTGAGSQA